MSVKARMKVLNHVTTKWSKESSSVEVVLGAVYDSDPTSANYSFSKATPVASLKMQITNPVAIDILEVGKVFELTFEEV